jgi:hypothetical protein
MGELRADSSMDRRTKAKLLMDTRKTGIDGFKALLSADQQALYEKKMQEMKDKQKAKGKNKPAGKGQKNGVKQAAEDEINNEDVF